MIIATMLAAKWTGYALGGHITHKSIQIAHNAPVLRHHRLGGVAKQWNAPLRLSMMVSYWNCLNTRRSVTPVAVLNVCLSKY